MQIYKFANKILPSNAVKPGTVLYLLWISVESNLVISLAKDLGKFILLCLVLFPLGICCFLVLIHES